MFFGVLEIFFSNYQMFFEFGWFVYNESFCVFVLLLVYEVWFFKFVFEELVVVVRCIQFVSYFVVDDEVFDILVFVCFGFSGCFQKCFDLLDIIYNDEFNFLEILLIFKFLDLVVWVCCEFG